MNILVLTYWSYKDGLIQTYTLPYLRQISSHLEEGSKIYLFTLEKDHMQLTETQRNEARSSLASDKIEWLPHTYNKFGVMALIKWGLNISKLYLGLFTRNIRYIHCFCTPPAVAGSVLSTLSNKPLVIDSYEPHAEASLENGDWAKSDFAFRFLFGFEKFMSRKAHTIISATKGMRNYALKKYDAQFDRFYVKPACVDLTLFSDKNKKQQNVLDELDLHNKIVCVYAGKFGGIYLDQEVFDFFKVAQDYWGENFRVLLLTNQSDEELQTWAANSGFDMRALQKKFVMHSEVPDYLGVGDFGITPVKPIPTKRYCTPIKNGEYWALGLPIVSTANISDDSDIIEKNNIGSIISDLTDAAYQKAVEEIDAFLKNNTQDEQYKKIRAIAEKYRSFDIADKIYSEVYGNSKTKHA